MKKEQKEQMDLQMISYLKSEEHSVKRAISDSEQLLSNLSDVKHTLEDDVLAQALSAVPHWESELEFLRYKLEWLESQIYYFGTDKRMEESLQRNIEFLKQRGEY